MTSKRCVHDWEHTFGEVRSLVMSWGWEPAQRRSLLALLRRAIEDDSERYKDEWAPYIREALGPALLTSMELEDELLRTRDGGQVLVYMRPTSMEPHEELEVYPLRLYKEYGLSLWQGRGHMYERHERMRSDRAPDVLMGALRQCMAYGVRIMSEDDIEDAVLRFLEELDDDAVWMRARGVLPEATFLDGVCAVGARVSGFMLVWDED